ncbi:class I SAM-dependent methyltransferase [Halegenticoccus tardaugens]|uniref:class I SAM-dependent methyltransferase n=1 Tax=Halegenticoccus tardaugens TaxID=2071624 RepID=UPI0013E90DFA|nr:class I SAM-dependent methyltransferase [Halegenticoccus tardaugens]
MSRPDAYSFERYLAAKRTVDDRALHRPTLDRLTAELAERASRADGPVRILEVGVGIGTMLQRLLSWGALPDRVLYTGVDVRREAVDAARQRLPPWARDRGYRVDGGDRPLRLLRDDEAVTVEFAVEDAFTFAAREAVEREWDAVVGCAFLDLVELPAALDDLFDLLAPDGLCYFPITFDGETVFAPAPDPAFERGVIDAYHATMDAPDRPGGSRTGRRLFSEIGRAGGEVLSAGGSDWVVHPPYSDDEAYFLHHIVDIVERAVGGAAEPGDENGIDREDLRAWAEGRHDAVEAGELTYVAHQIDLLGRVP